MPCLLALCAVLSGACGRDDDPQRHGDARAADQDTRQGDADPGYVLVPCPQPRPGAEMVRVTQGSVDVCIDRYEAHYLAGELGDQVQADSDTDMQGNGSTTATVGSAAGELPLVGVSWYQAVALCANSGGRLCTRAEWEAACRGPELFVFPYGDALEEARCNDYIASVASDLELRPTGSFSRCFSPWGLFDLSGNAEEWLWDAAARPGYEEPLDRRMRRGGSYSTNFTALPCAAADLVAGPNSVAPDRGFRCCVGIL